MKRFLTHAALALSSAAAIIAASCSGDIAVAQVINPSQPATGVPVAGTGISVAGQTVSVNYGTVANTALQGNALHAPTAIGDTAPNTGAFTSVSAASIAASGVTITGNSSVSGTATIGTVSATSVAASGITISGNATISGTATIPNHYYLNPASGASATNVQTKLQQIVSTDEFASWGAQNLQVGDNGFPASGFVGSGNVNFGYNNMRAITSGYANKSFGDNNLQAATTAFYNNAFGDEVLYSLISGTVDNGFGTFALGCLTTANADSGFGDDNQRYATTASYNFTGGSQALYNNLTGGNNVALGVYAMRGTANPGNLCSNGVGPSPTNSTATGYQAFYTASGSMIVANGYSAGYSNTGSFNLFDGAQAGYTITSGANDVFVGYNAGNNASQPVTSTGVTSIGEGSYTLGNNSVAVGIAAIGGANGISIGQSTSGATNDIVIGAGSSTTGTTTTIIGNGLTTTVSNVTLIGGSGNTGTFFYGGLQPQIDNTFAIGGSGARWTAVWATNGTIQTSDARLKKDIRPLNKRERAVAMRLAHDIKVYRWKNSDGKYDNKIHAGWMAQTVKSDFEKEGLNADDYNCVQYDKAHDLYSVSMAEIQTFVIASLVH